MGKGQTKGRKGHKGKARPAGNKSRAHTEEAWRHAQQVNARRKAEGKDARSTASISRSQRRAQQHHLAKAKPDDESSRARSRSPLRRGASSRSPAAEVAQRSPSYSEESRRKVPAQVGPEPEMIPWWTLRGPQQLQKLQVRFFLSKNIRGSV